MSLLKIQFRKTILEFLFVYLVCLISFLVTSFLISTESPSCISVSFAAIDIAAILEKVTQNIGIIKLPIVKHVQHGTDKRKRS